MLIDTSQPPRPQPETPVQAVADAGGNWPRTTRVMPWSVAIFLVLLWLVPLDSAVLPVALPFDLELDRIALGLIVCLWIASMASRPELRPRLHTLGGIDAALLGFLAIAVVGVLVNATTLAVMDEFEVSLKALLILFSFAAWFYMVSTVLRPREIKPFVLFTVVLGALTAAGTAFEYRSGVNLFYTVSEVVFPGLSFSDPPPDPVWGRELISGPTQHAIAVATMFAFALPFAVLGYVRNAGSRRFWYGVATVLIMSGAFATVRKTGALAPATAMVVLAFYRPRALIALAPLALFIVLFAQFVAAPGSVVRVKAQLVTFDDQRSVEGRREDAPALASDLATKPLLGRGHGSYNIERYRLLDNEYLQRRVETGYLGVAAYLLLILAVAAAAHRVVVGARGSPLASPAVGIVAGAAVFGVASVFFDILSFPQPPYIFLFLAGLAVVASRAKGPGVRDARVASATP